MIAPRPDATCSEKQDVLAGVVARVLAVGATEFEVEYKDGEERVFATHGPAGFGTGSFPTDSPEATALREQLYNLKKKGRKIICGGVEYFLRVEIFDSFGEDAFRVAITKVKK
jgi:hypothetical protein